MGEMKRANAYEEERRTTERFASTLAICASIIAAVRLARDENITRPSPRLSTVICRLCRAGADDLGEDPAVRGNMFTVEQLSCGIRIDE
jgi:hypothetical protein